MPALIEWKEIDSTLVPVVEGERAAWAPLPGSQVAFLACPIYEALYEGNRGPGKTDCLLMDFGQHVDQGYGAEWTGVLFRQTYPQLQDVIVKTKKWFPKIWPLAKYNETKTTWTWPTGETLLLRYMLKEEDYWNHHGHSYPWIGWEEITTWPDPGVYLKMMSCSRSSLKGMPRKYRATTNPYGPGHNWVKQRWRLPIPAGHIIGPIIDDSRGIDGQPEPPRVAIHGHLRENKVLLHADPDYIDRIRASARSRAEAAAWIDGDWNIVAGGMFDDVWNPSVHVVPNVPPSRIPLGWRIDRSYDHGQSRPFSVGWWAESNGEPMEWEGRTLGAVRGDLFRIAEWYGWTGAANEGVRMLAGDIARGILEREDDWGLTGRVRPGAADTQVFDDYEPGKSVAGDMLKVGVRWMRADKGPGSRKQGWEQMRTYLRGAEPVRGWREHPGLFVFARCYNGFIRTVPGLPRCPKDPDDVDKKAEDHVGDEVRYRLRAKRFEVESWRWK